MTNRGPRIWLRHWRSQILMGVLAATVLALGILLALSPATNLSPSILDSFTGHITTLNLGHTAVCVGTSVADQRCGTVWASHLSPSKLRIGQDVLVIVVKAPMQGALYQEAFVLLPA